MMNNNFEFCQISFLPTFQFTFGWMYACTFMRCYLKCELFVLSTFYFCNFSILLLLSMHLLQGFACNADQDCMYGICQNKMCASPLKGCPNDCNGHGTCVYYAPGQTIIPASACTVNNPYCTPSCQCAAVRFYTVSFLCSSFRMHLIARYHFKSLIAG